MPNASNRWTPEARERQRAATVESKFSEMGREMRRRKRARGAFSHEALANALGLLTLSERVS